MDPLNKQLVNAVHAVANARLQKLANSIAQGKTTNIQRELADAQAAARAAAAAGPTTPVTSATRNAVNNAENNVIQRISSMSYNNVSKINNQGRNGIRNAKQARQRQITNQVGALMARIERNNTMTMNNLEKNEHYISASQINKGRLGVALAQKRGQLP